MLPRYKSKGGEGGRGVRGEGGEGGGKGEGGKEEEGGWGGGLFIKQKSLSPLQLPLYQLIQKLSKFHLATTWHSTLHHCGQL